MAYQQPPPPDLVINQWQNGIADSPMLGFGDMRNVDILTEPGVAKINWASTKVSGSVVVDLVKWIVKNPVNGDLFGLGDAGNVYTSTDGGSTWSVVAGNTKTSSNGNGLGIFKDYLIVVRNTAVDAYGPLSSSPAWTSNFASVSSDTNYHPVLYGQDDILYIGNTRYIASLQEVSGQTFAPGTGATFTFTAAALTLPANYKVKCLAELGKYLVMGTWIGSSIYENKTADLFLWDRSSTSFQLPLRLSENGINQIVNVRNRIYIVAGTSHRVYITDGTTIAPLKDVPQFLTGLDQLGGLYLDPMPGAIMVHGGRVFTAISAGTSSSTIKGIGAWSINNEAATLNFENQISTGITSSSNSLKIGALFSNSRDIYLMSWRDNTTYGIDMIGNSARYTSYAAYVDSALYRVGTPNNKKQFTSVELQLAAPLATGQGIRLYYRFSDTDSYTQIGGDIDFATYGAIKSWEMGFNGGSCDSIQIRAMLTTGNSTATSPKLLEVRLR